MIEKNNGNAGKHTINIYFSDDNVLDGSDLLVGSKDVQHLKSGKDAMVPVKFELPDDADLGNAFLIVKVDGDNNVSESDERNNAPSAL